MALIVRIGGGSLYHILLCERMLSQFSGWYAPRGPSLLCSNAVWLPTNDRSRERAATERFQLGHLSRLTAEKGLPEVLETLRRLVAVGIDADLRLAGPVGRHTDGRQLEAASQELQGRVHLLGPLDGVAKSEFYASIDAFVFPTKFAHEAEPLVVLEALAAGTPVVAFGRGCIQSMIEDAGLSIPPGTDFVSAAVPYLTALAQQPEVSTGMRQRAMDLFERTQTGAAHHRQMVIEAVTQGGG